MICSNRSIFQGWFFGQKTVGDKPRDHIGQEVREAPV